PTKFMIYDLFLHVLDTAVYLLDEPIVKTNSSLRQQAGQLRFVSLQLETEHQLAHVTMDLKSGANTEMYQVTSDSGTYLLKNLTDLTIFGADTQQKITFGDWETTLHKRGFEQ